MFKQLLTCLLVCSTALCQETPAMRFTNLWNGKLVDGPQLEVKVAVYGKHNIGYTVQVNGLTTVRETGGFENFVANIPFPANGVVTAVTQGRTISVTVKRPNSAIRQMTATSIADMITKARNAGDVPIVFTFAPGTYVWPLQQPGGFLTRTMPIMVTGGKNVIIRDAWPEVSHIMFSNVRIEPTTTAPAVYCPTNSLVEVLGCEIAPPNNLRQNFQSRGVAFGSGRRIVIGTHFHHICLPIVGSEFIQNNLFNDIGETNINSPSGLIEGNMGLNLRAWLPQVHMDTVQWYGGENFLWENVIFRHNIFLDQEAQGVFAHGQRLKSFAVVGNLITWGGVDRLHGMHLDTCVVDSMFVYHNTMIGGYSGLFIHGGMLTNSTVMNNLLNGDGTENSVYAAAGSNNVANYNASTTSFRPFGPNSFYVIASTFIPPLWIPMNNNPVFGAGSPVQFCSRTYGLVNYTNPPHVGFLGILQ